MQDQDSKKAELKKLERDLDAVAERDEPEPPLRTEIDAEPSPISPSHPENPRNDDPYGNDPLAGASPSVAASADVENLASHRRRSHVAPEPPPAKRTDLGKPARWVIGALVAVLVLWLLMGWFG